MRNRFEGIRALVTGASSGLGNAFAAELARGGARVFATGRDGPRLSAWRSKQIAAGVDPRRLNKQTADLTNETDRGTLVSAVFEAFDGRLDLVVQSAGVGAYGRFLSHRSEVLRSIFEINFFALAELSRAVFPLLKNGERPAMVVVGSIVGRRGLPGRPEYSASKFAVSGLVEALRAEWSYDGVHILLVNPGFTRTEFEQHLLVDTAYKKVGEKRTQLPDEVVRKTLRALDRRKNEITLAPPGPRLLLLVNRLCPRFVDWGLARWTAKLYKTHRVGEPENGPPLSVESRPS